MPNATKAKLPKPETALPLFFTHPVALNPERHGNAGIRLNHAPEFARATNSLPLNTAEFMEAAKYYPIAFTMDDPIMPIALVGLEQTNLFLEGDGNWRAGHYIPAYVRKHPFIFAQAEGSDTLTLCVEEQYPHFITEVSDADKEQTVVKLFEHNEPSNFTRNALAFCTAFQQEYNATHLFCETLKQLDLLEPNRSDIQLANGRKIALTGFQLIDQKKFNQLADEQVLALHKQGMLPLMYAALFSLSNWQRLLDIVNKQEGSN